MSSRRWHAERKRNILRSVAFLNDEYHVMCFKKKKEELSETKMWIENSADCHDWTQEREIYLSFFVLMQNARKVQ
jgi:hypothetical protein